MDLRHNYSGGPFGNYRKVGWFIVRIKSESIKMADSMSELTTKNIL